MVTRKAVIDTATGAVKRYGYCDFASESVFDAGTETEVSLDVGTAPAASVLRHHNKIVASVFVEMEQAEKDAADLSADVLPDKFRSAAEARIPGTVTLAAPPALIDGLILRPDAMLLNTKRAHVRITCSLKTDGAGAVIRFNENGVEIDSWVLPDTLNVHTPELFTTSEDLTDGLNSYEVTVELGSATSGELKHASIGLFDR